MQAVQFCSSTSSTTCEEFAFGDKPLSSETQIRITAEVEAKVSIQESLKVLKAMTHQNVLGALQESERLLDFFRSFNPEPLLAPFQKDLSRLTTLFFHRSLPETLRSFFDDFLLAFLEEVAEAEDEAAFLFIGKAIDWSGRTAEEFVRGIKLALKAGALLFARELSSEGVKRYPDHRELQKSARVLAQPKVIRSDLPPVPSVKANREWLKEHAKDYRGRWIALRNGELKEDANSFDELVEKVGDTQGILLTKV